MPTQSSRPLRNGDLVEVRTAAEILETLDANGELEALPFMPEMIAYLGRRFVVDRRAEKICDTIHYTGSRRLKDTVVLEDLRCDGGGHGGCQAECRFFWKEAWLRRIDAGDVGATPSAPEVLRVLAERIGARAIQPFEESGRPAVRYLCQATELPRATVHLRTFDPRPYLRELTSGNVPFWRFVRVTVRAAVQEPMSKLGLLREIPVRGKTGASPKTQEIGLQPGEWVRVKSRPEIAETLNDKGRNRGLWFDREMLPYCGGTYRVRRRINKFIDEGTGKMIELKNDCVTLDGVVCSGERSLHRWFCPRLLYPYWRESWLRRIEAPAEEAAPEMADAAAAGQAPGTPGGRSR